MLATLPDLRNAASARRIPTNGGDAADSLDERSAFGTRAGPASVGIVITKETTFDGDRYWHLGFKRPAAHFVCSDFSDFRSA